MYDRKDHAHASEDGLYNKNAAAGDEHAHSRDGDAGGGEHTHEHIHEHTHPHAHTHSHDHDHEGEHAHAHAAGEDDAPAPLRAHEHSPDGGTAPGMGKAKLKAILSFMKEHNKEHAVELRNLLVAIEHFNADELLDLIEGGARSIEAAAEQIEQAIMVLEEL